MTKLGVVMLLATMVLVPPVYAAGDEKWVVEAYHRSMMYERVQKLDDAIKALALVFESYPQAYTINLRLGWLHYLAGRHANSIEHYQRAIKAVPEAAEPRLGLALPLLAQQKYVEAEEVLVQVLRTDFYNYYGNLRLLMALRGQGKYKAARVVSLRMLKIYPADVTFLAQLAALESLLGDKKRARNLYLSVYTLDPENVEARAYLRSTEK